ncbi:hypothetical protein SDC9_115033 [bioreactor metagenome]|uniref:Uncharacterized protein n=1 Tax=bioreactor metagenome TaxID=1076179 RepID=A0A645BS91_9ZZZZ
MSELQIRQEPRCNNRNHRDSLPASRSMKEEYMNRQPLRADCFHQWQDRKYQVPNWMHPMCRKLLTRFEFHRWQISKYSCGCFPELFLNRPPLVSMSEKLVQVSHIQKTYVRHNKFHCSDLLPSPGCRNLSKATDCCSSRLPRPDCGMDQTS